MSVPSGSAAVGGHSAEAHLDAVSRYVVCRSLCVSLLEFFLLVGIFLLYLLCLYMLEYSVLNLYVFLYIYYIYMIVL